VTEPELVADAVDRRVEILCETDAMHATRTRLGPRRAGTDPHVHCEHNDVFYVLEGELTFDVGHGELPAPAGTFVLVPPGVEHTFANRTAEPVRVLNIHAPAGFDRRLMGD
jgi:mannose-6-phosphate isomerase-like protein (cupin superfamily)